MFYFIFNFWKGLIIWLKDNCHENTDFFDFFKVKIIAFFNNIKTCQFYFVLIQILGNN